MKKPLLLTLMTLASYSSLAATSVDLVKSTQSWDGTPLPTYHLTQPEVTIKEIIIEPGERLPLHIHPVINAGVLLEGTLTVKLKEKEITLNAGDGLIEVMNKPHFGINPGTTPAKIIVFYLAEKGETVTLLETE
ncbi:cupin domain-containing protein [Vibrio methylphosphonaticus]|uniref:cupin domain-containing protein n=1 Tax=Vibrio methylphosphonaticus TaxID=2946866 RepID=UPI00202AB8D4|nr:cupin domain-containing protein [Vibrio methylphosphonaticus]MCL9776105.1 cupin domain-containing protein [Vibrio methylphosphonaticus]